MKQHPATSPGAALPVGTQLTLDGHDSPLTLGAPTTIEGLGWQRVGSFPDGTMREVVEIAAHEATGVGQGSGKSAPGVELPDWFERALALNAVPKALARLTCDGHLFVVLAPSPYPTLDRLLRRRENLSFYALTWIRALTDFFGDLHEAGLAFRRVTPESFSLTPEGSLVFHRPDLLRQASAPSAPHQPNPFAAPEVAERANSCALADQFALALLVYAILAQGIPAQADQLPALRLLCKITINV